MTDSDLPTFYYSATEDINDGKEWSDGDIADLKASLKHRDTIEEAASFLCRSSTVEEVRKKADELGLRYAHSMIGFPRLRSRTPKPKRPAPVERGPKMHRWKGRLVRDKIEE